ncbi:hypothetical protein N0V82_004148 [Gnomoniopsis sp. IMI 355080]|nr:hypothetical protein N0V82_004148 [Gnomoniopsis sp. IMI 355080]
MVLHLLLVRHGESVDNVAGLYAGSRDSPLTNHGVLQAQRLGAHLAARSATIGPVHHIFASNLKRAVKTAQTIAEAQSRVEGVDMVPEIVQSTELREKDFGSEEGKRFGTRGKQEALDVAKAADWIEPESQDLMKKRIERFVDAFFVPTVLQAASDGGPGSIVIVAHGIILNVLLRSLLVRFGPEEIAKLAKPGDAAWRSEWLASWSNTGFLEAELRVTTPVAVPALIIPALKTESVDGLAAVERSIVQGDDSGTTPAEDTAAVDHPEAVSTSAASAPIPNSVSDSGIRLTVRTVNCIEHLQGLKKTRGGIGSAGHDEKQKTMDSFFSRPAKKLKRDESDV